MQLTGTMKDKVFSCRILKFETLKSTNLHAIGNWKQQSWDEGTIIWAKEQSSGIGQSGNHWVSEAGKSLTFSIILKPTFLPVSSQFELHKVMSVAVWQTVHDLVPDADTKIKWPNDIYIGNRKLCGILVNNVISSNCYQLAVAGTGLNVNQTVFPPDLPNPTSLKLESGTDFDLEKILTEIVCNTEFWYRQLKNGNWEAINRTYFSHMLNFGTQKQYRYRQKLIEAVITGVDKFGRLILRTKDNRHIICDIKEIEYIF